MPKQKRGRIENPVLEQRERRKKAEARRKYIQDHKPQFVGIAISFLILIVGVLGLLYKIFHQ